MELTNLTAISPIDGRYRKQVAQLDQYFSEYALIKYRVLVEIEYFLFLADKKFFKLSPKQKLELKKLAENFSIEDALQIKQIESITNHDVKAVEYFLKEQLEKLGIGALKEWIHFGLTSQDINNTSIPLSWKECMEHEYYQCWPEHMANQLPLHVWEKRSWYLLKGWKIRCTFFHKSLMQLNSVALPVILMHIMLRFLRRTG